MSEYKIWAWWNLLNEVEQEEILSKVYKLQECGMW
jgi:hypothetical protein